MYDQWFTIALLALEFGQVWAEHVCHDVTPQLRLSARFNIEKYAKYHTTLQTQGLQNLIRLWII